MNEIIQSKIDSLMKYPENQMFSRDYVKDILEDLKSKLNIRNTK